MQVIDTTGIHEPVMPDECMAVLGAADGGLFVDATLGLGGHTERILAASESATVIGIDQDPDALAASKERLGHYESRFVAVNGNFSDIASIVRREGLGEPAGVLADIGVSSLQLDSPLRGFSFRFDAELDMRMDQNPNRETAAQLLLHLGEQEIANIIYNYGEERASRRIARRIVQKREAGEPVRTTSQLAALVRGAVKSSSKDKIHPATRTFQALRIAVNDELGALKKFIDDSVEVLRPGGVLAVITFHSLEDRIVKQAFQRLAGKCQCPPRIPQCVCGAVKLVELMTRKPMLPSAPEIDRNPRSRSAKLRACRKVVPARVS